MKATTRRGGAGALPAAKKKRKKKAPARGFMCGCGGAKSVSTVSRAAVSICAVTPTPMKATTSTAAPALKPASPSAAKTAAAVAGRRDADAANAEGSPSVDSLLRQLRELERDVRALGIREREDASGGGDGSEPGATRPRRHGRSASDWGVGRLESESVAVVTESEDPLGDFRRSMVQMIVENGITGGAELRGLLQRFLSLNAACHHHLILRAFADVWEELFAGGGHAHAHAPAPPPPLPGAEKISSSYSYSSIASSSKRRPHAQPAAGADTLTRSRPDEFVSLPPVVPLGPVALLGLGAGTAAHLMLKFWPWLQLVGWEIDPMIVELSRQFFGMSDLEKATESGGSLSVHIGDALSPSATVGGFAGIVVDLFCDGKVIPQLQEVETWLQIAKKLMPGGRIMVNCGGADVEESLSSSWVQNPTVKALCSAFPGQLNWKRLSENESVNYVAMTGPLPDLDEWSASVPSELSTKVKQWVPCELA